VSRATETRDESDRRGRREGVKVTEKDTFIVVRALLWRMGASISDIATLEAMAPATQAEVMKDINAIRRVLNLLARFEAAAKEAGETLDALNVLKESDN